MDGLLDDGLVDMFYRRRLAKVAELMVNDRHLGINLSGEEIYF